MKWSAIAESLRSTALEYIIFNKNECHNFGKGVLSTKEIERGGARGTRNLIETGINNVRLSKSSFRVPSSGL
jgi:hypothetical protein